MIKLRNLYFLAAATFSVASADTVYAIQSTGATAQYFVSPSLGAVLDLRGSSLIDVLINGTSVGPAFTVDPGTPAFGNTSYIAGASNGTGLDGIALNFVPGSLTFSPLSMSFIMTGAAPGPITALPLLPLLSTPTKFTFDLVSVLPLGDGQIASYNLASMTAVPRVPEASAYASLFFAVSLAAVASRRRSFRRG